MVSDTKGLYIGLLTNVYIYIYIYVYVDILPYTYIKAFMYYTKYELFTNIAILDVASHLVFIYQEIFRVFCNPL